LLYVVHVLKVIEFYMTIIVKFGPAYTYTHISWWPNQVREKFSNGPPDHQLQGQSCWLLAPKRNARPSVERSATHNGLDTDDSRL